MGWQGEGDDVAAGGLEPAAPCPVLLRRKLDRPLLLVDRIEPEQPLLHAFAEVGPDREVWEYAALATSLDSEIVLRGPRGTWGSG